MPWGVAFKAPHELAIATLNLQDGKKRICSFYSNVRGEMWICGDALISPCTCAQRGWSCAPSEWWTDYTEGTAWCWSPADSAPKSNDTLPRLPSTDWRSRPPPPGSRGTHRSDSWCEISQVSPSGQHIWGQEGQASIRAQVFFPVKHNISSHYKLLHKKTWLPGSYVLPVKAKADWRVCLQISCLVFFDGGYHKTAERAHQLIFHFFSTVNFLSRHPFLSTPPFIHLFFFSPFLALSTIQRPDIR